VVVTIPCSPRTASTASPSSAVDAVRREELVDRLPDEVLGVRPGDLVEHPHRAGGLAGGRDDVDRRAGADDPPHDAGAGAGVEPPAQGGRELGDQHAQRIGEVLGQVRPRGVPAPPGQPDLDVVGRSGDRPDPQPDVPDVERRVAVEPESMGDPFEPARGDHLERTARHDLLGRLEEQPHAAG
jgi:hypothetical protein